MTLEDEIKAMEDQLASLQEEEVVEEKKEEVVEEKEEESVEEKAEEEKPEPVVEEKPEEDAKGAARLRIEAKKERERADKLAAELAQLREDKKKEAPEEEKQEAFNEELVEVVQQTRRANAAREFMAFEEEVRAKDPEYDAIAAEFTAAIQASVRLDNPKLSAAQIKEATVNKILQKASHYAVNGYDNPVEALLDEARSLGFTGASRKKDEGVEEKAVKAKPDMSKVAENRKKSPGMAAAGGGDAQGQLTKKYAVDNFTLADFEKLSTADAERLMYGS